MMPSLISRAGYRCLDLSRSPMSMLRSSMSTPFRSRWAPRESTTVDSHVTARVGADGRLLYQGVHSHQFQCLPFSTRTRRRRLRGGGAPYMPELGDAGTSPGDESPTSESNSGGGSFSSEQFQFAANELLDRVETSLNKLKGCNDGVEIVRYPPSSPSSGTTDENADDDEIGNPKFQKHGGQLSIRIDSTGDVFWGGGTYWLTIHPSSNGFVALRSPLSGTFNYVYNSPTGEWVGDEDGHSLLGMLTRDWIRQCQGVPDF
ncbi:hypothetical protein ACHAWF_009455 [Thalassiosira exigua]